MTFVKSLRTSLQQSFLSLPLILVGWSLFMGAAQGNIGLLVLALGQISVVPLSTFLSNIVLQYIGKKLFENQYTGDWTPYITILNKESCNLIPDAVDLAAVPNLGIAPSFWMTHVIFFFSFLISNAVHLLTMKAAENADPEKVQNRKAQATLSIVISSILFVLIVGVRYLVTGCETLTGMAVAALIATPLGYSWFKVAQKCSLRDSDIFGVIQKILAPSAEDGPPMTCVYRG